MSRKLIKKVLTIPLNECIIIFRKEENTMAKKHKKLLSKLEIVEKIAVITASATNTIYIIYQLLKS